MALEAAGRAETAAEAAGEALSLAESNGYVRVFADEGPVMDAELKGLPGFVPLFRVTRAGGP
jgi:MalT-like TPR region